MHAGLIAFKFPGVPQVGCLFSTRGYGSVSLSCCDDRQAALARRVRLCAEAGVKNFAEVRQVHGVRTLFDPLPQDPALEPEEEADGLATAAAGLALMIKTADCQPILIAHESGRHILALHSGWRGNRQDYPFEAVCEFCLHYGIRPQELWAVRGPSLGPAAAEFIHFKDEWGDFFRPWYNEKARSRDLWSLTRSQLARAGLLRERILGLDICTFETHEAFFSYRHARKCGSADGRQASLIWIAQK